jgi:hypothetical protein
MTWRNLLANINRGFTAVGFITTAPIIVALAALTVATQASAKSSLGSSFAPAAPAVNYVLLPPEGGSLIKPATPPDTSLDAGTPSTALRSEPSAAVKAVTANNDSASSVAHSGWDRVGDVYTNTNNDDRADKELEVPQVLPPAASQPSDDDPDQTGQESENQSPDQAPTPNQVGSIDDYQAADEEDSAPMWGYGFPVQLAAVAITTYPVRIFRTARNPRLAPSLVPMVPRTSAGGMNPVILPTAPTFPRGLVRFSSGRMHFSGGMRGGRR